MKFILVAALCLMAVEIRSMPVAENAPEPQAPEPLAQPNADPALLVVPLEKVETTLPVVRGAEILDEVQKVTGSGHEGHEGHEGHVGHVGHEGHGHHEHSGTVARNADEVKESAPKADQPSVAPMNLEEKHPEEAKKPLESAQSEEKAQELATSAVVAESEGSAKASPVEAELSESKPEIKPAAPKSADEVKSPVEVQPVAAKSAEPSLPEVDNVEPSLKSAAALPDVSKPASIAASSPAEQPKPVEAVVAEVAQKIEDPAGKPAEASKTDRVTRDAEEAAAAIGKAAPVAAEVASVAAQEVAAQAGEPSPADKNPAPSTSVDAAKSILTPDTSSVSASIASTSVPVLVPESIPVIDDAQPAAIEAKSAISGEPADSGAAIAPNAQDAPKDVVKKNLVKAIAPVTQAVEATQTQDKTEQIAEKLEETAGAETAKLPAAKRETVEASPAQPADGAATAEAKDPENSPAQAAAREIKDQSADDDSSSAEEKSKIDNEKHVKSPGIEEPKAEELPKPQEVTGHEDKKKPTDSSASLESKESEETSNEHSA